MTTIVIEVLAFLILKWVLLRLWLAREVHHNHFTEQS